jgi:hypothetical protein
VSGRTHTRLALVAACLLLAFSTMGLSASTATRRLTGATPASEPLPDPTSSAHAPAAAPSSAEPAASTSATPRMFPLLPPGSALPDDATCADDVAPAEEAVPGNEVYNATAGSITLPESFFDEGSHDTRATTEIANRVTGAFTGTTAEILQWTACKWGVDQAIVRAQAQVESSWRQTMKGDWTTDRRYCAPGHGLGVDGRPGYCPESWGILQVRYQFFRGAFPDAITSTAFNADTAYAVWRACYEGYEWWLADFAAPGHTYEAGDAWGCLGRWYSGQWHDDLAERYIDCVQRIVYGRPPC